MEDTLGLDARRFADVPTTPLAHDGRFPSPNPPCLPSLPSPTPATPTPANLIFAHRICELSRPGGGTDIDDSPLVAGRPLEGVQRAAGGWDRGGSTTPERPPPGRFAKAATPPRKEETEALEVIVTDSSRPADGQDDDAAARSDLPSPLASSPSAPSSIARPSRASSLARSAGTRTAQFVARPAPSTTYVPEHKVRQSRASLLRAGVDPDAVLSSSEGSVKGHVPTDFTAVPGHKRSKSNLQLVVPSILPPSITPRQNRASLIRAGQAPPPPSFRRAPSNPEARKALFANTPGHKRAESIAVASTKPPLVAPRQTRASAMRARADEEYGARLEQERQARESVARARQEEEDARKARRRSTIVLPSSLRDPILAPRQTRASLLRTGGAGVEKKKELGQTISSSLTVFASSAVKLAPRAVTSSAVGNQVAPSDSVLAVDDPSKSLTSLAPSVSMHSLSQPVRQNQTAPLRSGLPLAPTDFVAPSRAKKAKEEIFAGVPGHKRRASVQVHSTVHAPHIVPRQNRAALLRSTNRATSKDELGRAQMTRPASKAAGSMSRAMGTQLAATAQAPPSSFRPALVEPQTFGLSHAASRTLTADTQDAAPPECAPPLPTIAPRENRAAELRRLKRASVAF